jgi:putative Ca2+/H+ antiporter (TMEM165/GDT1 family)
MTAFLLSLALVFAAEFGDKTQLVALAFATKYKARVVLAGITVAALAVQLIAVSVGQVVGNIVPQSWINVLAGVAFIIFGLFTLRPEKAESDEDVRGSKFGPFISVALTFFIAELGDKTMLATMAIAGQQHNFVAVWLGSSAGLILSGAMAIGLGRYAGHLIPPAAVKFVGAAAFLITGIATLAHTALADPALAHKLVLPL